MQLPLYPEEQDPLEPPFEVAERSQLFMVASEQPLEGVAFTVTVNSLLVFVSPVEDLLAWT